MSERENIEKWLNGTFTEREKLVFEQSSEYKALEKLSKALMTFKAPEFNEPIEFQRLQSKKSSQKTTKTITMPWLKPLLRVAAVLVVMAGGYFIFLSNQTSTVSTLVAEKTDLFLPDSSKVTLNAFSEASFQAFAWKRKRLVKLAGEAFFKVKKGSQFDVVTDAGTVTVLGTQFNVKVRKDYFEVICYEGLVEVRSAGKIIKLPPTKVFRTVKGLMTSNDYTTEIAPAWLQNESSFESVPFKEVIEEFERQYNTTVFTKSINGDQLFTGRFIHSDISLALKSISIPLNLKYEVSADGKNVVLSGEVK